MNEIVPAILVQSREELNNSLVRIRGAAHAVQIDVVDGRYVSNTTWPFASREPRGKFPEVGPWEPELRSDLGKFSDFEFEIDLMAGQPLEIARAFIEAGAKRIVLHSNSTGFAQTLATLQPDRHDVSITLGIALPCDASPDDLRKFENLYDFVQVMGIEKVGFQGQPFDERAIGLVRSIKERHPELPVQVDGGVNEETIRALASAGAARFIVGSRIMRADDPKEEIRKLEELANRV